ncbi:MAG: PhoH family protein [Pseudomonadota bacterium]
MPKENAAILRLEFEDNGHAFMVFGDLNRNLTAIEKKLSVRIDQNGNQVELSGAENAVEAAAELLNDLYHHASTNVPLSEDHVEDKLKLVIENHRLDSLECQKTSLATKKAVIKPRTPSQKAYIEALQKNEMVFGLGPAGTGKTYLAVAVAVNMFLSGQVTKIILTRPAVEAGENLGFLPGDLKEKVDPYLRPLFDALNDMLPGEIFEKMIEAGQIEIAPLAFMRGRTLAQSFVILDEAQNTTAAQMKMFLTRLGEKGRMAINGDPGQIDLPAKVQSGLLQARDYLQDVEGIEFIEFSDADVVRHPLVARIIRAYNAHGTGVSC